MDWLNFLRMQQSLKLVSAESNNKFNSLIKRNKLGIPSDRKL